MKIIKIKWPHPLSRLLCDYQCHFCDMPLPSDRSIAVCTACHHELPWHQETTGTNGEYSAFYYQPPISEYLLSGKTSGQLDKLRLLGELLAGYFSTAAIPLPEAIVPVPLHPQRLRQRGFNQSIELIRTTANQLKLPILPQAVQRIKQGADQKQSTEVERQQNIRQAFRPHNKLSYQHIAIFDDVVTTGATSRELRQILLTHGIKKVDIWCCATTKQ